MINDNKNKHEIWSLAIRLLEERLTRRNVHKNYDWSWRLKMGRISVDLPDELEKQLRFKTIERFGGKKGDLSKAVQEAVRTWTDKKE